jgi:hypothetical protein
MRVQNITKINPETQVYDNKYNVYDNNHPKQVAFVNAVVKNLIVECGLPFNVVEHDGFIKFQKSVDIKYARIFRSTICTDLLKL